MKIRYLLTATVVLSIVSLFIGVVDIKPSDLLDFESEETRLFLISRIPRLVAILLAGAGMSIAGLIMQSLSRNKFVSPTTAGTLDATKLGVLISMMFFTNVTYFQKNFLRFHICFSRHVSLYANIKSNKVQRCDFYTAYWLNVREYFIVDYDILCV